MAGGTWESGDGVSPAETAKASELPPVDPSRTGINLGGDTGPSRGPQAKSPADELPQVSPRRSAGRPLALGAALVALFVAVAFLAWSLSRDGGGAAGDPAAAAASQTTFPERISDESVLTGDGLDRLKLGMTVAQASRAAGWPISVSSGPSNNGWLCSYGGLEGGPDEVSFILSRGRIVVVTVHAAPGKDPATIRTVGEVIKVGMPMSTVRSSLKHGFVEVPAPYIPGALDLKARSRQGNYFYFRESRDGNLSRMEVAKPDWVGLMEGCL